MNIKAYIKLLDRKDIIEILIKSLREIYLIIMLYVGFKLIDFMVKLDITKITAMQLSRIGIVIAIIMFYINLSIKYLEVMLKSHNR